MTVMQSCLEMEKITDWSIIQTVRSLRSWCVQSNLWRPSALCCHMTQTRHI